MMRKELVEHARTAVQAMWKQTKAAVLPENVEHWTIHVVLDYQREIGGRRMMKLGGGEGGCVMPETERGDGGASGVGYGSGGSLDGEDVV